MAFTDWHSGPPTSGSSKQEHGFVCMSTTVDDLSYTPSEEERSRDAAQFVATGRRSWKTLKGKGEAVWPPLLEAALLEALEKYQPDSVGSKTDKTLGRFPMRNRFISDYIFETTGKRRTPKQVGSRLQQLRDTCKKEKILQLISHRGTPEPTSASSQSDYSPGVSPSPSPDSQPSSLFTKPSLVYIKIALQNELWPSPTPSINFVNIDSATSQSIQLAPLASPPHGQLFQGKSSSNILPFLSGYVQFPSPSTLMPQSTFLVYVNGTNAPVHMEHAPLKCISSPVQSSGWLYGSDLVPGFWGKLCSSQDVSQYTILQTLKPMNSDHTLGANNSARNVSIVYKFSTATESPSRKSSTTPPTAYSPTYMFNQSTLTLESNILYSPWQPPQHENLDVNYSHHLASSYHVGSSFGITIPSGNPVPSSFSSPQQRCGVPTSRDVNAKYDTLGACSQLDPGSYHHVNSNFNLDSSNQAVFHQQFGYSYS